MKLLLEQILPIERLGVVGYDSKCYLTHNQATTGSVPWSPSVMTVEAVAATAVAPVLPTAPSSAPIPISAAAASQIFFPSDVAVPQAVSGSVQFSHHQQQFHSAVSGA